MTMRTKPGIMTGREAFMQNIANRLGRKAPLAEPPARREFGVPEHYAAIQLTQDERLDLFARSWGALTGQTLVVRKEDAQQAIAAYVRQIVEELNATGVSVWDDPRLESLQLSEQFAGEDVRVVPWREESAPAVDAGSSSSADTSTATQVEGEKPSLWATRSELLRATERCQLGVVWADAAIANTGTLVLLAQGGHGRSVSLLTSALLAVFHKDQLVTRMGDAFAQIKAQHPGLTDLPSSINLITGPSRSADIENDLTIGIHGPGKVYAVIIED